MVKRLLVNCLILNCFNMEILTTGHKNIVERGGIAPKEQFLLFSTIILKIYLTSGVKLHMYCKNVGIRSIVSSVTQI